mmetsp:Transcript_16719/g.27213  ORF Transcript_16719/g.27213 Transcript_16719/m.27213 type:complete len:154 (-) Transcript_16719:250-711(-)
MSIGYFKKNACVDRWCLLHQKWSGGGGRCAVIGCDRSEYTGRIRISTAGSIPLQHSRLHACHADKFSYVFECPETNDSDTNWASVIETVNLLGSNTKPNYADAYSISNLFVCPDFDTDIASIIETIILFGSNVGPHYNEAYSIANNAHSSFTY